MKPITFVHAADIHLDSPFVGLSDISEDLAQRMNQATFRAFDNIIELCLTENADFLLIAGDAFDGDDQSLRAQFHFRDGLARLAEAGIKTFIVHGNHDSISCWIRSISFPPEVTIFGDKPELVSVQREGQTIAHIMGISYATRHVSRNLAKDFQGKLPTSGYRIGLLHANVGGNPDHDSYAPCKLEDLLSTEFDYFALGHVHNRAILHENPTVAYPGNPQGRSVRETGPRGCYLVRASSRENTEAIFHETDLVRWYRREIEVAEDEDWNTLRDSLLENFDQVLCDAKGRSAMVEFALKGRTSLHTELHHGKSIESLLCFLRDAGSQMEPFVWPARIIVNTSPTVDLEKRAQGEDLLGLTLQLAASAFETCLESRIIPELDDFLVNPQLKRTLPDLTDRDWRRLLKEAGTLCYELLEGDS